MSNTAEQVATSNTWAFLHWLRATGRASLHGWEALVAYSAAEPVAFAEAVARFAGERFVSLARSRALAEILLHADLRPDDRVLVVGRRAFPWHLARRQGTEIIFANPSEPLCLAAAQRGTVLVAAAPMLERIWKAGPSPASLRSSTSPASAGEVNDALHLSRLRERSTRPCAAGEGEGCHLRLLIALGRPLASGPPGVLLLARAGHRLWGSALDPEPDRAPRPLRFFGG